MITGNADLINHAAALSIGRGGIAHKVKSDAAAADLL
ncbi:hypothetical protein SDC9_101448 [bioreactor metagenome]|uniref:Uncharacterized protein n=1 Tax=bioreactor metagenome TaxID=1076179 RepID=A0A645ANB0_9ZZZZ